MPRRARTELHATPPGLPAIPSFAVAAAHELLVEAWRAGELEGSVRFSSAPRVAQLADRLAPLGFDGYAVGGLRAVFFHASGWLLKCPLHADGAAATAFELERLAALAARPAWLRRHLPVMRDLGGAVLLQRRYRMNRHECEDRWAEIQHLGWSLQIPDLEPTNVGFDVDGTVVFVDFSPASLRAP